MLRFPPGLRLQTLSREHDRTSFDSGQPAVNRWLAEQALQSQDKRLTTTRVLVDSARRIAGYFTLASAQVDFGELPPELSRRLPRRALPIAVLAWLGVAREQQGKGLGTLLFARALGDCYRAGRTFPFVAVVIDCIDDRSKAFYQRWDFRELPGRPMRFFVSARTLAAMMEKPGASRATR